MKKISVPIIICALMLSFADTCAHAQIVSIPDIFFGIALRDAGIDKNKDGKIQVSEAEAVTELDVSWKSIASLKGIEAFKNLKKLICRNNEIDTLDVSKNKMLTTLACEKNHLTFINTSQNVNLEILSIGFNKITSVDISKNLQLIEFDCSYCRQLSSLDVHPNTKLKTLRCSNNQLTSLNVSTLVSLQVLDFADNQISAIDITKNENLIILHCEKNIITALDLSKNEKLLTLECGKNPLVELDLSKNKALDHLDCMDTPTLTKIYIAPGTVINSNWNKEYSAKYITK